MVVLRSLPLSGRGAEGRLRSGLRPKAATREPECESTPRVCRIVELRLYKASREILLDLIDAYHISRDAAPGGKWISLRVWRRVNSKIQKRDTIRRRLLRLGWGPDTFDPDHGDFIPKWVVDAAVRVLDWRSL